MSVPISQMWSVASYVIKQKLKGRKKYPLVLMLEPLLRCNLACAGCGKIQYPGHILKKEMSVEEALAAVDECDTPIVSIPGGEPLLHPQMPEIVAGMVERKKYVYLCTNAILLKEKIDQGWFLPSKYLTFSVHLDGDQEAHDFSVCRQGTYEKAEEAIRYAVEQGFRVTCNTTLFEHADVERTRSFFDRVMSIGVEGVMLSPGYGYSKAPDQSNFLNREKTFELFRGLFAQAKKNWKFNQSPLFVEFLMGKRHLECTPWGNPCYTLFGWQRPCYLLQEGYTETFQQLLDETEWDKYGRASGNPKCQNCMVHCGYEPTAVDATFGTWSGFWGTVKATFLGVNSERGKNIVLPPVTEFNETSAEDPTLETTERKLLEEVDFRGDALITFKDGTTDQGYLFNVTESQLEYFSIKQNQPQKSDRSEVEKVEKTGRDYADGQSWESWLRKHKQNKELESVSSYSLP